VPIVAAESAEPPPEDALKASLFFAWRKPLIYAAVSGPKMERSVLSGLLSHSLSQFPSEYEVILSHGDPNGPSVPVREGNLTVYGWVENQYELLKASDTHTEQYGNAMRACNMGFAELIPQREVSTERLLDATKRLLSSQTDTVHRLVKTTIGTDAIETAARRIMSLASESKSS